MPTLLGLAQMCVAMYIYGNPVHGLKLEKPICQKAGMPGLLQNERQRIITAQLLLFGLSAELRGD